MKLKRFLDNLRTPDWVAIGVLLVYVAGFSWMSIRQHESFQTNALDLAKFDQAIWNTAQGRPFQITLIQDSIVQSHFSPILAVYAPLYWVWPDIRLLFVVQSLCLAGAGFLIYWFHREDAVWLGLVVFAAYLLHPSLHQVNLYEFRRVTTGVLGASLALHCLFNRRYGGMIAGLAVALLSKENTAFLVIGVGLYVIFAHRAIKSGVAVTLVGAAWLILVPLLVLPALGTPQYISKNTGYSLAGKYFSYLGHSPSEMVQTLIQNPQAPLAYILRPDRLKAVLNLSWPLGFLFLLSPGIAAFSLPFLGYLLASKSDTMGQLAAWYPGIVLPLLFWAAGMGLCRLKDQWRTAGLTILAFAAVSGYAGLSVLRPAQWSEMRLQFGVEQHHRQVEAALRQIPDDAVVAAQDPLVPHLSHREQIYLFPWYPDETFPDYIILDREMGTYPVKKPAYRTLFYDLLAGTEYDIDQQIDSFVSFRYTEHVVPKVDVGTQFGESLTLIGTSPALAPLGEAFGPVTDELPANSTVRLSLFWKVDQSVEQNYTVFVHALSRDDRLLAQHDSWPADAHRPTSVLPPGTVFRDVHYLTLPDAPSDEVILRVGLYNGNGDRLLTEEGDEFVTLSLH